MSVLSAISRLIGEAFVTGLWQGLLLVAMVGLGLRLVPRVSASVRFGVWGVAFLGACGLPLAVVASHGLSARCWAASCGVSTGAAVRIGAGWGYVVAGIWVAMLVVRGARLAVQAARVRRIWRRAVPVEVSGELAAALVSVGRRAELCVSPDVDSPSVIGFFSPRLLVPEGLMAELSEAELVQIVLHECEHLRRRDDWINLAQKLALVVFPLNPGLMWVDRRLGLERELACDAGVVARTSQRIDYAKSLTRLAERRVTRRLALALSAWSGESELARRVYRLLEPVSEMSAGWARVCVGVLGVVLVGGAVEMARAPEMVAFVDAAPVVVAIVPSVSPMVPVVYRSAEPPKVVSVVMRRTKVRPKVLLRAAVDAPRVVEAKAAVRVPKARVVLTSAEEATPRVEEDSASPAAKVLPTFAVVQFGDGWLVLQL